MHFHWCHLTFKKTQRGRPDRYHVCDLGEGLSFPSHISQMISLKGCLLMISKELPGADTLLWPSYRCENRPRQMKKWIH